MSSNGRMSQNDEPSTFDDGAEDSSRQRDTPRCDRYGDDSAETLLLNSKQDVGAPGASRSTVRSVPIRKLDAKVIKTLLEVSTEMKAFSSKRKLSRSDTV